MPGGISFLTLLGAMVVPLKGQSAVQLSGHQIRVADVVSLSGLAPDERREIGDRVIAHLPQGRSRMTLSKSAVARLVRMNVPSLRPVERPGTFTFEAPSHEKRSHPVCMELVRDVRAGEPLSSSDLLPSSCPNGASASVRFDRRNGVLRAGAAMAAGTQLGQVRYAAPAPAVDEGARLLLVASSGPVRIEREVVALQAGKPSGRVFVIDDERNVSSVALDPAAFGNGR